MFSRYFKQLVGLYFLATIAGCGNDVSDDSPPELGSAAPTSQDLWNPDASYVLNDTVVYDLSLIHI